MSESTITTPEWLTVGAEAIALTPQNNGLTFVTITKITKTQVVAIVPAERSRTGKDFEYRFRRPNLTKTGGGTWDATTTLVSPSDPLAHEVSRKIKVVRATDTTNRLHSAWLKDMSQENAAALIQAIQAATDAKAALDKHSR